MNSGHGGSAPLEPPEEVLGHVGWSPDYRTPNPDEFGRERIACAIDAPSAKCSSCNHMASLHRGGCQSAKRHAQAARELDELRTSLTDARFVLAMIVKALEDTAQINLDDSGEYETKLVREAKRVLTETTGQV